MCTNKLLADLVVNIRSESVVECLLSLLTHSTQTRFRASSPHKSVVPTMLKTTLPPITTILQFFLFQN